MQKRSLTIAGHRTSLALEAEFWAGLKAMAEEADQSLPSIIRTIDEQRDAANLSSAIRIAVLRWYQQRL